MRAGDEEACHAEAGDQSLGQPYQAIVALTIATIADGDTEQELSEDYEHGTGDDERPVVSGIEEAANGR